MANVELVEVTVLTVSKFSTSLVPCHKQNLLHSSEIGPNLTQIRKV